MYQKLKPKDIRVRPLPFPYVGALSISSDVEFFRFDFFESLMSFLNTSDSTIYGRGLDLEVTSSMFFWSLDGRTFSYFKGDSQEAKVSIYSSRIEEYLKAGLIDTNHSYGDFFRSDKFTRGHAVKSLEVLDRLSIPPLIFTNHGGNTSNFGSHEPSYKGDVANSKDYNSDLIASCGTRYVWLDQGKNMIEPQKIFGTIKYHVKETLGYGHRNYALRKDELFHDCTLRDGSIFKGFVRFRSTGKFGPNLSSLDIQLRNIDWPSFYKDNGIIVIYQHLGVLDQTVNGCISANTSDVNNRKEFYLKPFYFLEKENKMGKLWVVGTAKLLTYAEMIESTVLRYDLKNNCYEVLLDIESPMQPKVFFAGLTFYVDSKEPIVLKFKNEVIETKINEPDHSGRPSVSVPLQPLENIWN